jgi:hypothetical protein
MCLDNLAPIAVLGAAVRTLALIIAPVQNVMRKGESIRHLSDPYLTLILQAARETSSKSS